MKRAALLAMVVGPLVFSASCGGTSSPSGASPTPRPTATPAPAAAAPTLTDGATEQPIAAESTPPTVRSGDSLVVRASGYLPREQIYDLQPIALWPAEEDYVRELVYDWEFTDGSFRMIRWETPFTLSLDGDLAADGAVLARVQEVIDEIARRTGISINVGAGGEVLVIVDPSVADGGAAAEARLEFQGESIRGATVAFVDRAEVAGTPGANYDNTLLHEMGHVMGLAHSPRRTDVMTAAEGRGTTFQEYQPDEAVSLHMMYFHRSPGNRPPDKDPRLVATSAAAPRYTVIVD